jgi:hypothetical protein
MGVFGVRWLSMGFLSCVGKFLLLGFLLPFRYPFFSSSSPPAMTLESQSLRH